MCYVNVIVFKSLKCCYEKSNFVYNRPQPEILEPGLVDFTCIGWNNYVDAWFSQIDIVSRIVCHLPGSYRFREYFVVDFDYWSRSRMFFIRYRGSFYTISSNPVGVFYAGGYICCACQ